MRRKRGLAHHIMANHELLALEVMGFTLCAFPDAPPEAWRAHGYQLLKEGRREEGRAALNRYLALAPRAPDSAMVRQSIAN